MMIIINLFCIEQKYGVRFLATSVDKCKRWRNAQLYYSFFIMYMYRLLIEILLFNKHLPGTMYITSM